MTHRPPRRTARTLLGLVAVAGLGLLLAPPAQAQWSEEYWFTTLQLKKTWAASKGAGVTVAVVDTGVDASLGDLKGQVLPGKDLSGGSDARSDPGAQCDHLGCYSHGTDMSLVIAGTGRGSGFEGIAPAAKILPVKVQRRTGLEAPATAVADGIRWAVDHGAQIVNVSLAHVGPCDQLEAAAVRYAYDHDVIVVAGAGNDGIDAVYSPADCPGALGVSAAERSAGDAPISLWNKSNYGPEIAFAATGVDLPQELTTGTKVTGAAGTSQATAITSADLALVRARFPHLSARDVVTRALWSVHTGTGRTPDGRRVNDRIGYGEILPLFAVTGAVPAGFPNPIYDAWQRQFATSRPASTPPASSSPAAGASSPAPTAPNSGTAPSPVRNASSGSSGSSSLVWVLVGVGVLFAAATGFALARRSRGAPPA